MAASYSAAVATSSAPLGSGPQRYAIQSKTSVVNLSPGTCPSESGGFARQGNTGVVKRFSSRSRRSVSVREFGNRRDWGLRIVSQAESMPLKVMIAGAPASGKGTQCELIVKKFGLTHISAGDLLRAEVAAGTEEGKIAKEFMDRGELVPSEIVVTMVKNRLAQPDAQKGWLLDGYPRSLEQAEALEAVGIRPQVFILLEVPDDKLIGRVVGRRSDPVTGKIYHLTMFPPETEEIAKRLEQRSDDTEDKVKTRVQTHHTNVQAVIGVYEDILNPIDGDRAKEEVFEDIAAILMNLQTQEAVAL